MPALTESKVGDESSSHPENLTQRHVTGALAKHESACELDTF